MSLSPAQVKGRIKNIAKANAADARILMRIYGIKYYLSVLLYASSFFIEDWFVTDYLLKYEKTGHFAPKIM